jgi:tetratricopeptide (TPR) repeat protein
MVYNKNISRLALYIILLVASTTSFGDRANWVGVKLDGSPCQGVSGGVGPFDYRKSQGSAALANVEGHHFNANVEHLRKGISSTIEGDLDYTIRAFPNHSRALYSIMRWWWAHAKPPITEFPPPECYLQRAIAFTPDDANNHKLLGLYYHKAGRLEDALASYQTAEKLINGVSIELFYNMGLLYLSLEDHQHAVEYAQKAYAGGYPLPGLRNMLVRGGHWPEE